MQCVIYEYEERIVRFVNSIASKLPMARIESIDDLIQIARIELWQCSQRYDRSRDLWPYASVCIRRKILEHLGNCSLFRRASRERIEIALRPRAVNPFVGHEPEDHESRGEFLSRKCFADLTPRDREICAMYFWDGYNATEIGQQLGLSKNSITDRLRKSLVLARVVDGVSEPPKPAVKKIGICAECSEEKPILARGLCNRCYRWQRRVPPPV